LETIHGAQIERVGIPSLRVIYGSMDIIVPIHDDASGLDDLPWKF